MSLIVFIKIILNLNLDWGVRTQKNYVFEIHYQKNLIMMVKIDILTKRDPYGVFIFFMCILIDFLQLLQLIKNRNITSFTINPILYTTSF